MGNSATASGGSCGSGALAAGFSGAIGPVLISYGTAGVIGASVTGGIGSVLGGGKFANGAVTGAFGYLYNTCGNGVGCLNSSAPKDFPGVKFVDTAVGNDQWAWVPQGAAGDSYTTAVMTTDVGSGGTLPFGFSAGGGATFGDGLGVTTSCSTNGSCYYGGGLVAGGSVSGSVGIFSYSSGYPYGPGAQFSASAGDGAGFRGNVFLGLRGYSIGGGFGPVAGSSVAATLGYRTKPMGGN